MVWVLNISLKLPCSPLLADKPHGRINVMKTILYQKKCCYHDNTISIREVMDSCYNGVTYTILSIIIVALIKKRVKHHIIPRIIRNMSMVKHRN